MRPNIDAIRKRLEAATPGDWEYNQGNIMVSRWSEADKEGSQHVIKDYVYMVAWEGSCICDEEDVKFIAHAPTDIRELLEYVEELEAFVKYAGDGGGWDPVRELIGKDDPHA
jgi:hypothetical protein